MTDTDSKTPTVLIVEDEQSLADVYAVWLSESYSVKTTYSGEQALDAVDESIDVVLLDRRMPRVSGDEVLEHIRRDGYDVRVVIVSAITPDVDVLDMRFDEYLVKPVDSEEVVDVVERMVARSRVDDTTRELAQLWEITLAGGDITIRDRDPHGTCVAITLPRGSVSPFPRDTIDSESEVAVNGDRTDHDNTSQNND